MYLPERFPIPFSGQPIGGPTYSTRVATTASGHEQRNQNWAECRWYGDGSIGAKTEVHYKRVLDHFRMARGRLHHFRLKDYAEFHVERTEGVLVQITTTTFQIYKQYGAAVGFEDLRKITRPVAPLSVWKDSVLQTITTHYTVDMETGIVTFLSAPGASVLEVETEFDIPVRYDTDKLQAVLLRLDGAHGSVFAWEQIPLVEHRE